MRTTLRIDDSLASAAKRRAAEEGITLTALIEDALRETLAKREKPRTRPPLPVGRGGLPEGVDFSDNSAVLDWIDSLDD